MIRLSLILAAGTAIVAPSFACAQAMGGMSMPGMRMPPPSRSAAKPAAKKALVRAAPRRAGARPAARTAVGAAAKPAHHHDVTTMPDMNVSPKLPAAIHHAMPEKDHAMPGMDHAMPAMDHAMPAMDQTMSGMDMSKPAPASSQQSMAGMDMSSGGHNQTGGAGSMPGMATPDMVMPGMQTTDMEMTGTALPAGNGAPPAPPSDHYAAKLFPVGEIERAHHEMARESGGQKFAQIMFNLAEIQVREGKNGYRWEGQGWFGGDIERFVIKTEGEGVFREGIESAEVQALYSRAIDPYFNVQVGVRHDFQPTPSRTYATVAIEGLAPYWFEVEGALFLSEKGDVHGRLEGYYDQRITQRLILQPRVELNFAAQNVPESRIGVGLSDAELGLRVRYEISRKFAPYVGVSYEAKAGRTADYARADGKKATSGSFVTGVHFWF